MANANNGRETVTYIEKLMIISIKILTILILTRHLSVSTVLVLQNVDRHAINSTESGVSARGSL